MEQYTNAEVVVVAKKQKTIIWLMLTTLAASVFPPALIIMAIVNVVFVYQLAQALKRRDAWAWCAGMFVPLVSLLLLLLLNGKATAVIRSKGVTVGLMGANKAQLDALPLDKAAPPTISGEADERLARALKLEAKTHYEEAIQEYDRLVQEFPNSSQALEASKYVASLRSRMGV